MSVQYKKTQNDISFLLNSGCLWTLTIIQAIMAQNKLDKFASGELVNSRKPVEVEFGFNEIKDQSKPYAFQTHLQYRMLPSEAATKNVKIIYISRNPKDVAVSGFHFMKKIGIAKDWTWDDYFEKFYKGLLMNGSWFDHEKDWLKQRDNANVMFIRYEDLIVNTSSIISDMAWFIERPLDVATLRRITQMTTFDNMKDDPVLNMIVPGADVKDQRFLRKGKVGDWKNMFNQEQSEIIDNLCEKLIKETGIKPYVFEL